MKRLMYSEKSLMMGDEVVDLMMEYAVALAQTNSADRLDVHAITTDGEPVTATFLIGPATIMVAETTNSSHDEPDNESAEVYLREQIGLIKAPPVAHGLDDAGIIGFDDEV